MTPLSPTTVFLAFCGGAFGAAIGALPSFTFTGFLVVVGEAVKIARGNLGANTITESVAFGVVFGPHVSFAGGAAAAAYAAKKGYLDTAYGFDYHAAKDITSGLGTRTDVLAVGGLFGVVGYVFAAVSTALSAPWDPVAAGVVVSAFAHRAALGYSLVGDSSLPTENWLPYQHAWRSVALLGVTVGALGGYVAHVTRSPFLAFGISAATLVLMTAGVERVPVTHHIALPASTAALGFVAGASLWQAVVVGAVFGLAGALAGEVSQRLLYARAETHLDPPAVSIVATTFVIGLLAAAGVTESVWVPHP